MGASGTIPSQFVLNKAKDHPFMGDGLRAYREYRDLGVGETTKGAVHAHLIRTTEPCPEGGSGLHYHDLDFQMVFCLKGRSRIYFEGVGEVEIEAGDSWVQPPRIPHNVLYYSPDYELLEITMPQEYPTVAVKG